MASDQTLTIDDALAKAKKAFKKRDYNLAGQLYTAVIQVSPDNQIAKKGLRKLKKQGVFTPESLNQNTNPGQPQLDSLLMLFNSGNMPAVEQACRETLKTYPESPIVLNLLAGSLMNQNRLQASLDSFNKAISHQPDFAEAFSNRSHVLLNLGLDAEALQSCERAIDLKPELPDAYFNKGNVLKARGQFRDAIVNYDEAIRLQPQLAQAHNNRGLACLELGDEQEAFACWDRAIQIIPNYPDAYINRANLQTDLGQLEGAIESYERAISIDANNPEVYNQLGRIQNILGRSEDAKTSYEHTVRLKPTHTDAHYNLSLLTSYDNFNAHLQQMRELVKTPGINEPDLMRLGYSLGKASEDIGEYAQSFTYIEKANDIASQQQTFQNEDSQQWFHKVKTLFSGEPLELDNQRVSESIKPILIVGMPRSGTTLIEQILASHSMVYGAGELETLGQLIEPILMQRATQNPSQPLTIEEAAAIRAGYLQALEALGAGPKIITDKMPLNFRWLGFFLTAFPESKVIHVKRDPMAVCWSIYKHSFDGAANAFGNSQLDLADYYHSYLDLMAFWAEKFPGRIYDLEYENLTENQEEETRKLIDICDLAWEDRCLRFHETPRVVQTLSSSQVREAMYTGSSDAWRNYEEFLQPLIERLGTSSGD